MTKRMYYYYQRQDIPLLNILPRSEYYGMNTYADKVLELADNTLANIEKLKQFTYEYVGAFVDVYRQRAVLEAKKSSGFFINDEEYQKAIQDIKPDPKNKLEFEFKPAELRRVLFDILKYPIKAWTTGKKPQPKIDKYAMKKLVAVKRKEGEHFNKLEKDVLVAGASEEEYEQLRASLNPSKQKKADDSFYQKLSVMVRMMDRTVFLHTMNLLSKLSEINIRIAPLSQFSNLLSVSIRRR